MTSHQVLINEPDIQSPKKDITTKTMGNDIHYEISPTGIMGFPQSTTSGKPVVPRSSGIPTISSLDMPDDETAEQQVQHRISTTCQYWEAMEQELMTGNLQFFVPRCDNPFEAFMVHQGHVQMLVEQWNMLFAHQQDSMMMVMEEPPLVPMPGDAVLKLAAFFDHLAEQRLLEESMEPFVATHTYMSDKIRQQVAEWEERMAEQFDDCYYEPVTVYRHVSPKIRPLVNFWNEQAKLMESPCSVEPAMSHKNPKVVVMANLMQKQLEHLNDQKNQKHAIEMDASTKCMVVEMVSLLEAMNYNIRTGGGNPLDQGHVHHIKTVPMVC